MSEALAKAAAYRERAQQMKRKSETACTDDLRRAYLVLERVWQNMANQMALKALAESRPRPESDLTE